MKDFESAYESAINSNLLPGIALLASSKDGKFNYTHTAGVQSLNPDNGGPFTLDTICAIASMTKLLTAVSALQCIEAGTLHLDEPVHAILPEVGTHGIITGFDDEKNLAMTEPNTTPITLRMLLSNTSGHEYDWFSPVLLRWRASRNEPPWSGPTVEEKSTLPLVFPPGTSFAYGAGSDWTGKMIERVTGKTLETFMKERIWDVLGVSDFSFYPKERSDFEGRIAGIATLGEDGEGPAVDAAGFDVTFGATDCLGGGGGFASPSSYFTFLQAVLRRDSRLLKEGSWDELFRPQLDERCEEKFNEYINSSPLHQQYLGMCIPKEIRKTWCFGGMVCKEGVEGRFGRGCMFWGGVPSMEWFIDQEAGICGLAACQIIPPMAPRIMSLHEEFQRGVYGEVMEGKGGE